MRVLVIKQQGPLVVVETSAGLRASSATVQGALSKLSLRDVPYDRLDEVARIFNAIPDDGRGGQIHEGVQS